MGALCAKEVYAEPINKKATPKKRDLRKKNSLIFGIKHINKYDTEQRNKPPEDEDANAAWLTDEEKEAKAKGYWPERCRRRVRRSREPPAK